MGPPVLIDHRAAGCERRLKNYSKPACSPTQKVNKTNQTLKELDFLPFQNAAGRQVSIPCFQFSMGGASLGLLSYITFIYPPRRLRRYGVPKGSALAVSVSPSLFHFSLITPYLLSNYSSGGLKSTDGRGLLDARTAP